MRFSKIAIVIAGLLMADCFGQSLGEVAKQERDKPKIANTSNKVITNEDIPESSDPSDQTPARPDSYVPPPTNDKRTAAQWKAAILRQKSAISGLQKNVDRLRGSIHFIEANRYRNGVQYNQSQMQKQQDAEQMQKQLDALKRGLEEMQESARHLGLGSAVYDP
jgi:predicted RNase H-like nuclease (RuvC/YqgF family)